MRTLLSLPPCLLSGGLPQSPALSGCFCATDPQEGGVGSGGGAAWLLKACHDSEAPATPFAQWLPQEKRILLQACGQSRRLPSYAPSGKALTPIPIFRWAKGQRLSQNLLELQLPLYRSILESAPEGLHTLVASGDVLIRSGKLGETPFADVVCYGLWAEPELASAHGVFVSNPASPSRLEYMLQKPTIEQIGKLLPDHLLLMDAGLWLLSDRAVAILMRRSIRDGKPCFYDLYGRFGLSLGDESRASAPGGSIDEEVAALSVAVVPLPQGEFYHFGTNREMIASTLALQNIASDQRSILHLAVKPHPSIFVQNAVTELCLTGDNRNIWIENSHLPKGWTLTTDNIVTGVPHNDWQLSLSPGVCVDIVPWADTSFAVRPYGFNDTFRGSLASPDTSFLGMPAPAWLALHGLRPEDIEGGGGDIQQARLFPIAGNTCEAETLLQWMLNAGGQGRLDAYLKAPKTSASELCLHANIDRLEEQRAHFRKLNLTALALNHRHSIFYQTNLSDMAQEFARTGTPLPAELADGEPPLKRIAAHMFRSELLRLQGHDGKPEQDKALALLRHTITQATASEPQSPRLSTQADQIVWSRSPLRIDIAGGWTDTPPYCLASGGTVVNLAVELNGQPPIQAYIKASPQPVITLRSIDLGASETVTTHEQLADHTLVGSPFSIPKAALMLAGFHPSHSAKAYPSLRSQLEDFGAGIEITLLSAVPAGSGMGTSSILAATILAALSDFCSLRWDKTQICQRTLALEQMLTTGGGWQDQYGGALHGIKTLRTAPSAQQTPLTSWLPDTLFTDPQYAPCHLLYYTGITRTAKTILQDIVRSMLLQETDTLALLDQMKSHAEDMHNAIMHGRFEELGRLTAKSWRQNMQLDSGTNPPSVQAITDLVHDLCLGYKLAGAGGGGFLYMIAKDAQAASRIRQTLLSSPPNPRARFVEMTLCRKGTQTTRS